MGILSPKAVGATARRAGGGREERRGDTSEKAGESAKAREWEKREPGAASHGSAGTDGKGDGHHRLRIRSAHIRLGSKWVFQPHCNERPFRAPEKSFDMEEDHCDPF